MEAAASKPSASAGSSALPAENKLIVQMDDGSTVEVVVLVYLNARVRFGFSNEKIISLRIPPSVTTLGARAFQGCTSLASVALPDNLTIIGASAFQDCTSLAFVPLPASLTRIAVNAFQGCTSLAAVVIPDGVTTIAAYAFQGCTSLDLVIVPDSVTTVGVDAFRGLSANAVIICNLPDRIAAACLPTDRLALNFEGKVLRHPKGLKCLPKRFARWPTSFQILYMRCRRLSDEAKRAVLEDDGVFLEGIREIFPDMYKAIIGEFCDKSLQTYEVRLLDYLSIGGLKSLHECRSAVDQVAESEGQAAAPAPSQEQEQKMITGFMGALLMPPPKDDSGEDANCEEAKSGPGPAP